MLTRLKRWWRNRHKAPCYVIIYDDGPEGEAEEIYYGYFSSPEEARMLWMDFTRGYVSFRNVKLCRVVEDW